MQRRRMIDRPNQAQGKSWISVIWGVILLIVGFGTMMSTSAAIGAAWTVFAVVLIVNGIRKALAPKNASKLDDSVEKVVSRIQNKAPEKKNSPQQTGDPRLYSLHRPGCRGEAGAAPKPERGGADGQRGV